MGILAPDQSGFILVVDDVLLHRTYAREVLEENGYRTLMASSGREALQILETNLPRLILLDVMMAGLTGYETFALIRDNPRTANIPIIFLTAEKETSMELEGFRLGAADYIYKPFIPEIMLKRVERVIEFDRMQKNLETQIKLKSQQLERVSLQAITAIAATVDAKDRYTEGHSERVAKLAVAIAKRLGWTEQEQFDLYNAALLHDIGKIGVPDAILNKPARLSGEEYAKVKEHTIMGRDILQAITVIRNIADGAYWHHEWYDGSGYPNGAKGEEIPVMGRVIAVADAYDAMTSRRPYRKDIEKRKVIKELERCKGTQFDPRIVEVFVQLLKEGLEVKETQEVAVEKGNLASESNALLYSIYKKAVKESKKSLGLDSLTQIFNRKFFEFEVNQALEGNFGKGALIMLDVDNYKAINDSYGHFIGDQLLIMLADTLRICTRDNDIVGRIGGDEFAMFISGDVTLSYIKSVTDNIRQKYDQSKYDLDVDGLSALSMGVAVTTGGGRNSMHSFVLLYKKADKALYYTKQHGKASCSFYNELIEQGKKQAGEQAKADLAYLSDYVSQRLLDGDSGPGKTEYELIYQIIRRGSVLQYKRVELVLFTLVEVDTGADGAKHVDGVCMERLKRAIGKSLRRVDFDLKYSDNQYLVMLMGTTVDVAGQVASRIADHYYSLCGDEYAELVYDAAILRLNL